MYNGHADITALINETGAVLGTYYYDAFGNIEETTGTIDNPFTYAGYQYDKETGLYYLNSRMYDPKIARFMQEDSYRGDFNDPLSLNLYSYCHNEPIMYWDPTGHIRTFDADGGSSYLKIVTKGSSKKPTVNVRNESSDYNVKSANKKVNTKITSDSPVSVVKKISDQIIGNEDININNLKLSSYQKEIGINIVEKEGKQYYDYSELIKNTIGIKELPTNLDNDYLSTVKSVYEMTDEEYAKHYTDFSPVMEGLSAGINNGLPLKTSMGLVQWNKMSPEDVVSFLDAYSGGMNFKDSITLAYSLSTQPTKTSSSEGEGKGNTETSEVTNKKSLPDWLKKRFNKGNEFNKQNRPRYPYNEVEVTVDGKKTYVVDSYIPGKEIVSRKFSQLANVKESTAKGYLNEFIKKILSWYRDNKR